MPNQFEIPIVVNSGSDAGASEINEQGSQFTIRLNDPILMPNDLINCTVQVDEATIWWTIPNISVENSNNKFYYTYLTVDYNITLPNGLYSISDLNNTIERLVEEQTNVSGLFTFGPDNATQKTIITANVAGAVIDFTQADTIREIIGFNSQLLPAAGVSVEDEFFLADETSNFNSIQYFLIHSDIVDQGIRTNNTYTQTISQVLIDVKPGSQIVSREFNPPKSNALNLNGRKIDRIKFWLTDQDNNLVDTNGEVFGCRLVIKYTRKDM